MQTPLRPIERITRSARFALSLILLTSLGLALGDSRMVAQSPDPNAGGPKPMRGQFSDLPFEQIDMLSGELNLTIPIFQLTGNAGMDLNVAMTYSRNGAWRLSLGGLPMRIDNPDASAGNDVVIRTWDGSVHRAYLDPSLPEAAYGSYVTEDFWRYEPATRTLSLPNGWVAAFESGSGARLQELHDQFGNSIGLGWSNPGNPASHLDSVTQGGGGATRSVAFGWDSHERLTWANFYGGNADGSDRIWTLGWSGGYWTGPYHLETIQPPVGPAWQFSYGSGPSGEFSYSSLTVTTPTGGSVDFGFGSYNSRYAVVSRTTGGPDIVPGTWQFEYGVNPIDEEVSANVHTPLGRHVEYRHKNVSGAEVIGPDWVLTRRKVWSDGEGELSKVDYEYEPLFVTDENAADKKKSYALKKQTITQGGDYLTTYEYRAATEHRSDYHQPYRITETSAGTRSTTRTFAYFNFHLAGAVETEQVSVDGASFTTTFTHDSSTGFLTSSTLGGLTTAFSPDGRGNVGTATEDGLTTSAGYAWGIANSMSSPALTTTRVLNQDGTVASESVGGHTTTFGYDGLGRQVSVTPPGADANWITYAAESINAGRGNESATTHLDGFGRPTGTSANNGVQTTRSYDALGRVTHESAPFVESWTAGNGFTYDGLGRVKTITHADGSTVQFNYSGGDEQRIDENGHSTTMHHKTFGSALSGPITDVLDPAGQTWHYTYNKFGSLTVVDAPTGPDRVWNYDSQNNRLNSTSQPESGTVVYDYLPGTRFVSKKTDAAGQVVNYEYDGAKRIWKVDYEGSDENDLTYSYEPGTGRLASIANTHASSTQVGTSFQYDAAGRLANREDQLIGTTFNTHYDYDGNDRLTALTYPSGRVVNYSYHVGGRLASVTGPNGLVYANNFSYHPSGAIAAYQLGNGRWHSQTLDNRQRPQRIISGTELDLTYSYDASGNVTSIEDPRPDHSQWFGYDALDRLTGVSGYQGMNFSYDALGNRTSKGGTDYQYDPYTLRHIQSTGSEADFSIQYDANGNRTNDNHGAYAYRPDNLMRTATVNGNTTTYQYDGNGQRIATSNYDGIRITTHGPAGGLLSEFVWAGSPSWIRDSIYAGTQLLAIVQPAAALPLTVDNIAGTWWGLGEDGIWRSCTIEDDGNGNGGVRIWNEVGDYTTGILNGNARTIETGDEWAHLITDISANTNRLLWQNGSVWVRTTNPVSDSETLLYFHLDALGSVRHGTNMSGTSFARHDYGAFGEGPWTAGLDEKLRFTGAERDAETFLDYMGARYYRNVNGRFNQPDDPGYMDPLNPQSMNRYAYVQNNPLRWVDPTGHTPQEPQSPDKPVFRIEVWGPIVVGPPIGPPAQLSPEVIAWLEFQWQTYSRWRAQQMERLIEEARANGELPMTYGVMPLGPPGAGWLGGVGRAANAAKGANSAANIANKIIHIFRPGKNLEGLVRASGGSPEAAYTAVQQAANQALRGGVLKAGPNGVLPGGGAGAILNVNGVSVQLIGGFIKDGVVYIGSFVGR